MLNTTTTAGLSSRTLLYAEAKMLAHAGPQTVLDKMAVSKTIPKNSTRVIKFRRPRVFAPATTPLQEGVTPSAKPFGFDDVEATIQQYGDITSITDWIEDTHEDPVLNEIVEQEADNIARTREALMWAELRAGTAVNYANGSSRAAVNTPISLNKQRAVVQSLKRQKAKKLTSVVSGSPMFKTTPIEASYVAVGHTDLEPDIRGMPGFTPCSEYGSKTMVSPYEIGAVEDVRYVLTADLGFFADGGGDKGTMRSTSGTKADVYPLVYIGKEAYGTVALAGRGAVSPHIIPVGQRTKDDPLGQRGSVSWKMWFTCVILNQQWMRRLEVATTDLG